MISLSLSQFPPNYGIFPYFLITDGYNQFVQFPIQFLVEDNGEEHALSLSPARQFRKMRIDLKKELSGTKDGGLRDQDRVIYIGDVPFEVMRLSKPKRIAALAEDMIEVGKVKLKELRQERDYKHWLCLVLSEHNCYFIDDDEVKHSCYVPMGGELLSMGLKLIAANRKHYRDKLVNFVCQYT